MELTLANYEGLKFILDGAAFFLLFKLSFNLFNTFTAYLDWRKVGHKDLDLEYLEANPVLLEIAQEVFSSVYVGYVMNADERKASYWVSIRWKVASLIFFGGLGLIAGYYVLAAIYVSIISLELVLFHQGLHAITKESEPKIQAILES